MNALSQLAKRLGISEEEVEAPFRKMHNDTITHAFKTIGSLTTIERKALVWWMGRMDEFHKIGKKEPVRRKTWKIFRSPFDLFSWFVLDRNPATTNLEAEDEQRRQQMDETKRLKGELFPEIIHRQWDSMESAHLILSTHFFQMSLSGGPDESEQWKKVIDFLKS